MRCTLAKRLVLPPLSETQGSELRPFYETAPKAKLRLRAPMILLAHQGRSVTDIAAVVVCRHTKPLGQGRQGAGGGIADGAEGRHQHQEQDVNPLIRFTLLHAEQASLCHETRASQGDGDVLTRTLPVPGTVPHQCTLMPHASGHDKDDVHRGGGQASVAHGKVGNPAQNAPASRKVDMPFRSSVNTL
jgi:hypothetical protein